MEEWYQSQRTMGNTREDMLERLALKLARTGNGKGLFNSCPAGRVRYARGGRFTPFYRFAWVLTLVGR